jgi:hypothetical protein
VFFLYQLSAFGDETAGFATFVAIMENKLHVAEPYVDPGWAFGDGEEGEGANVSHTYSGSDNTFASASPDDVSSINLFSFEELLGAGGDGEAEIEYVTAKVTTKKTGETGFLSLVAAPDGEDALDEDYEATPAISILSDSFSEYELVWEENPATNHAWTADSLSSFIARYTCTRPGGPTFR